MEFSSRVVQITDGMNFVGQFLSSSRFERTQLAGLHVIIPTATFNCLTLESPQSNMNERCSGALKAVPGGILFTSQFVFVIFAFCPLLEASRCNTHTRVHPDVPSEPRRVFKLWLNGRRLHMWRRAVNP